MYLAEFAHIETAELAAELVIDAPSEQAARMIAKNYASNWGFALYSISLVNERQLQLHRLRVIPPEHHAQSELLV